MWFPFSILCEADEPIGDGPGIPRVLPEDAFANLDMAEERCNRQDVFHDASRDMCATNLLYGQFPRRQYVKRCFRFGLAIQFSLIVPVNVLLVKDRLLLVFVDLKEQWKGQCLLPNVGSSLVNRERKVTERLQDFDSCCSVGRLLEVLPRSEAQQF